MAEVQTTTAALAGEMTQRFIEFVMMQAQHAALFLGQIPHPETGRAEVNLDAARMFIDQLEMIQEKTRGNLSSDESKILSNALGSLRLAFVEVSRGGGFDEPEEIEEIEEPPKPAPAPAPSIVTEGDSKKKFSKSYGA